MAVIVADAEIASSVQIMSNTAEQIALIGDRYRTCIEQLAESGTESAAIGSALGEHLAAAQAAVDEVVAAVEPIKAATSSFLSDIDQIDSYLY